MRGANTKRWNLPRAGPARQGSAAACTVAHGDPGHRLENGNAVKHGFFTSEAIDERKFVRTVLIEAEDFLRKLPAGSEATRGPSERNPTHPSGNGFSSVALNK